MYFLKKVRRNLKISRKNVLNIHRSRQQFDTGVKMDLLQEYIFINLDIFRYKLDNNGVDIENELEAWLTFLSVDEPDIIIKLLEKYPRFRPLYEEVYYLCLNVEKVMRMFSKELLELDKNTVQYMIDEMQDEINAQKLIMEEQKQELEENVQKLEEQKQIVEEQKQENEMQKREIERLNALLKSLGY